jgi:hypothetical protein
MNDSRVSKPVEAPKRSEDCLIRTSGDHLSSIEQIRAKQILVQRSYGTTALDAIPTIGNGADRLDVRRRPKIR